MIRTRAELDEALFQLHASVPLWRRALEDEDALQATYRRLFHDVLETTATQDRDYALAQLDGLAEASGLFATTSRLGPELRT